MFRTKMISLSTKGLSLVIVVGAIMATTAQAENVQQSVLREVMRECTISDVSDATLFIAIPGLMGKTPTNQDIDTYVASKTMFKQATAGNSPCWTLERWRKYARAVLKEQQADGVKAGNAIR